MKKKATIAAQSCQAAKHYLIMATFMVLVSSIIPAILIFDLRQQQENSTLNYVVALGLGLFLMSGSISLFVQGIKNYRVVQKLEEEGKRLKAKITRKWIDTFKGDQFFRVSYRLKEDVEIWETVTAELFRSLDVEKDVFIRALEQEPMIARLER